MASLPQLESPAPLPAGAAAPPRLKDPRPWVKRADKISRVVITTGGVGIILAVLLILILILTESVPLWKEAQGARESFLRFPTAASDPVLLAFPDPYRETYVVLRSTGIFQQVDRKTAKVLNVTRVPGTEGWRVTFARRIAGRDLMALGLEDGRISIVEGKVRVDFSPRGRIVDFSSSPVSQLQMLPEGRPVRIAAAAPAAEGTVLLASSGESDLYFAFLPSPGGGVGLPGRGGGDPARRVHGPLAGAGRHEGHGARHLRGRGRGRRRNGPRRIHSDFDECIG